MNRDSSNSGIIKRDSNNSDSSNSDGSNSDSSNSDSSEGSNSDIFKQYNFDTLTTNAMFKGHCFAILAMFFNVPKKIGQTGGASWWRVCYQRGLTRLVFTCHNLSC